MFGDRFDAAPDPTQSTNSSAPPAPSAAWKYAYGVLGATVLAVVLGIGFFTYGGVFAPLSDAGGLLVGVLLAPLVRAMYRLNSGDRFDRSIYLLGIATVVGICLGSTGLVVMHVLSLDPAIYGAGFLGVQFIGWVLLGFWLLGIGALGLRTETVGTRVSWASVVAGTGTAGGMLSLVYSYAVGSFTPAFPLFMMLYVVGFVLWAYWLGTEFRDEVTKPSPSGADRSENSNT